MDALKFFLGTLSVVCLIVLFFVMLFWFVFNGMWYVTLGLMVLAIAGAITADEFL